ncbi:diaminopimelate epimerase [Desulfuribacillus stibiiarsenatis]|uniref:Diaminopimelate epimerase n=1 Tax=Desulfuribacillus stibiiarsenatis TaxID=1390249 RepID=A0A1E5L6V8_9FIRM|nr:diaminopimelate epimerase [Desulfuribacillus stibiiarsenatis]OEH85744.1 diaminopimelate epimerase [Desulfuribacillus stibiiarsenatis]
MKFTKMHGLGNDFVVVNEKTVPTDVLDLAVKVCDRNFGVGADGLVYILPSEIADFQMRIFNSDGTEAEQCGNAIRCVAKYIYDYQLTAATEINLETKAGIQAVSLTVVDSKVTAVRVNMGSPILEGEKVPTIFNENPVIEKEIMIDGTSLCFTAVSMGNPHAVIFVDTIENHFVKGLGPIIEKHEYFPRKTNVEFVEILNQSEVNMHVWERGCGETLACGTGACATAVAAYLTGRTGPSVTVRLKGGDLFIEWDQEQNVVYMTGPSTVVFTGTWLL